jgi:CDP-4-dehydro-6-deoxyglucose reductase
MTYRVTVKPSGISFVVDTHETILEAALRCGYFFPHNCRMGICASCKGKVLAGEIDYAGREIFAITPAEQDQGYALFCCAEPKTDLIIQVDDFHPGDINEVIYEIINCEALSPEVTRILLKAPDKQFIFYQAGQYIKIVHRDGTYSPLSIASAPGDYSVIELHLAHSEQNQMAHDILQMIAEEKKLTLRGPYGSCTAAEMYGAQPIIFLTRGTGFAPVKAIIEAFKNFKQYPAAMHLYWSATTQDELYLASLAKQWEKELLQFAYTPVLSRAELNWQGRTGLLQQAVLQDYSDLKNYRVYVSAPESIVYDALHAFSKTGFPRSQFFSDIFGYDLKS